MSEEIETEIGNVPLRNGDKIVVRETEWKGIPRVDIRRQVTNKDGKPVWSKQGISVPKDKFPELLKLLNLIQ